MLRFAFLLAGGSAAVAGCEATGDGGGGALFPGLHRSKEQWTIRCLESRAPNHREFCRTLADMLKQVDGISPGEVRVESGELASRIYYGRYRKVASSTDGRLVFPDEFQRDINLIRGLALNQATPFLYAVPELIGEDRTSEEGVAQWEVRHAQAPYTLQIAVFYNTATFQQRKEVAEQYVQALRDEGFKAFYAHEPLRSFVFVGEFGEADVVETPYGMQMGPNVQRFIDRKPDEFSYVTENGHLRKALAPSGKMEAVRSFLVRVPGRDDRS